MKVRCCNPQLLLVKCWYFAQSSSTFIHGPMTIPQQKDQDHPRLLDSDWICHRDFSLVYFSNSERRKRQNQNYPTKHTFNILRTWYVSNTADSVAHRTRDMNDVFQSGTLSCSASMRRRFCATLFFVAEIRVVAVVVVVVLADIKTECSQGQRKAFTFQFVIVLLWTDIRTASLHSH